jgi:hypothetical protein
MSRTFLLGLLFLIGGCVAVLYTLMPMTGTANCQSRIGEVLDCSPTGEPAAGDDTTLAGHLASTAERIERVTALLEQAEAKRAAADKRVAAAQH